MCCVLFSKWTPDFNLKDDNKIMKWSFHLFFVTIKFPFEFNAQLHVQITQYSVYLQLTALITGLLKGFTNLTKLNDLVLFWKKM